MVEFRASAAAFVADTELNARVLVLAEDETNSGLRLEVQREIETSDQERGLGMDTYCLVTETQATYYGGVISWSILGDDLLIRLDGDASRILSADGGYRIHLADATAIATVTDALRTMLGPAAGEEHEPQAVEPST